MQYVKLQIGCMIVIMYIVIAFIREGFQKQNSCNKYFDILLTIAPLAVFFDGLTAWMVNHIGFVSDMVNRISHLLFFLFMDFTIILTAAYMYEQLIGFHKQFRERLLLGIPGIISVMLIIGGIPWLGFIEGKTTYYSMGFSVYVCFATVIIYYGAILFLILTRHRFISKDKIPGTLSFIIIAGVILVVQIRFPEVLLTSILPTILVVGIYINYENPYIKSATRHNNEMVDGFATMVESRDNSTGGHVKRTRAYVNLMLDKMKRDKHYKKVLSEDYIVNVSNAAPLHDIGKISTPDSILQKPGKLTAEEFNIMKEHAATGGDIILHTFIDINNVEFREIAYQVARFHHEKYNGKGYPEGLKGEEIPLHARIMAIADVFDAVSQKRCYMDAMSIEESFAIIENGSGNDFDPGLVKIFLDAREEVMHLMEQGKAR